MDLRLRTGTAVALVLLLLFLLLVKRVDFVLCWFFSLSKSVIGKRTTKSGGRIHLTGSTYVSVLEI